ncbi:MAG: DNA replication/repair protein RecF [Chloroflexi bacterium]|nr:DNA replication/repair protein RecF [Chloroflexota bacterium]
MRLVHLSLRNFRNYRSLELELPPGVVVFHGDNAQGKSNLLEAVYLLAIARSHRAENEREMVNLESLRGDGYCRVAGLAQGRDGSQTRIQVDMLWAPPETPGEGREPSRGAFQKHFRLNGVPRSAARVLGSVNAVLFSAEDLQLVLGSPSLRRRFLDVLLSQVDRAYVRSLQRYHQVLTQRNHLLKRIGEGKAKPGELLFWDQALSTEGALIVRRRLDGLAGLAPEAARLHTALAGSDQGLEVRYRPSIPVEGDPQPEHYLKVLEGLRPREVGAGQSLVGPHRDDLALLLEGREVAVYGSRGQARTVALALRLAEARFLARERGEEPILLLDDVLSELDPARQQQVLAEASRVEQALVTLVALEQHRLLVGGAPRFLVQGGGVTPEPPAGHPAHPAG